MLNFENMKEKLKNRKKTFSKDVNSVSNQTRAKVCKYMLNFGNMKKS